MRLIDCYIKQIVTSIVKATTCKTISGPFSNNPCVFPFEYNGVKYNECTNVEASRTMPWCSVRVDAQETHVQGNWGYCDTGCPGVPTGITWLILIISLFADLLVTGGVYIVCINVLFVRMYRNLLRN